LESPQGDGDLVLSLQLLVAAAEHARTQKQGSNRQAAAVGNLVDLPLYHDGGEKRCHECTAKQINRTLQHADE
jgi:hypothetical protein